MHSLTTMKNERCFKFKFSLFLIEQAPLGSPGASPGRPFRPGEMGPWRKSWPVPRGVTCSISRLGDFRLGEWAFLLSSSMCLNRGTASYTLYCTGTQSRCLQPAACWLPVRALCGSCGAPGRRCDSRRAEEIELGNDQAPAWRTRRRALRRWWPSWIR